MKIAILVREETTKRCTGKGCLRSFFKKTDSFARYQDQHIELVAFFHNGGDLDYKLAKMKESGVEVIHLSTCLRGKDPNYPQLVEQVSKDFTVGGYTHGSEEVKNTTTFPVVGKLF